MKSFWVYILASKPRGTLYIGVTNDLVKRAFEHREGLAAGFTKRCGIKRLVYCERHDTALAAIQREKTIKHWSRQWKIDLIVSQNPDWDDRFDLIARRTAAWMPGSSPGMTVAGTARHPLPQGERG